MYSISDKKQPGANAALYYYKEIIQDISRQVQSTFQVYFWPLTCLLNPNSMSWISKFMQTTRKAKNSSLKTVIAKLTHKTLTYKSQYSLQGTKSRNYRLPYIHLQSRKQAIYSRDIAIRKRFVNDILYLPLTTVT